MSENWGDYFFKFLLVVKGRVWLLFTSCSCMRNCGVSSVHWNYKARALRTISPSVVFCIVIICCFCCCFLSSIDVEKNGRENWYLKVKGHDAYFCWAFLWKMTAANDSLLHYPGRFLCCHHFPITVAVLLVFTQWLELYEAVWCFRSAASSTCSASWRELLLSSGSQCRVLRMHNV